MANTEIAQREVVKSKLKEPSKYKVIVLNDDHTPMDFVIVMLMEIFKHNETSSVNLTMRIHEQGSAVAGIYTYEIAEQKGIEVTLLARNNGFTLQVKIESE